MKSRILLAIPAVFSLAVIACSAEVGSSTDSTESTGAASEAVSCNAVWGQCGGQGFSGATCCATGSTCTYSNPYYSQCLPGSGGNNSGCPSPGANDAQQRAAATAAYGVLKAASAACSLGVTQPCWGTSLLSSQHYRVASSGTTIEFDPSGPVYSYVSNAEKAALAIAQLDSSTAAFLVAGLQWDQANTNGQLFVYAPPTAALSQFTYPGNANPITVNDPAAGGNRRKEVVTGSDWCGTTRIHMADTSSYENGFAPFQTASWSTWFGTNKLASYHGSSGYPSSPFNGSGNGQNPYLVVSMTNSDTNSFNWNSTSFSVENCPNDASCVASLDIDPIPYTQSGAYYDANGNLVGPQANPFSLVITNMYADSSHAGQWATRTVAGVQQWGTFSTSTTVLGSTVYGYVKVM